MEQTAKLDTLQSVAGVLQDTLDDRILQALQKVDRDQARLPVHPEVVGSFSSKGKDRRGF